MLFIAKIKDVKYEKEHEIIIESTKIQYGVRKKEYDGTTNKRCSK